MWVYIYLNRIPWSVSHIPTNNEFWTVKEIMDWLYLQQWYNYHIKLHMPPAWRRITSTLSDVGTVADYWTSAYASWTNAYHQAFTNDSAPVANQYTRRSSWFSIRCFLDTYVEPDSTRTVEAWELWQAWIFHNAELWIISLTDGNDRNITMRDKNVWATVVYNYWDTMTEDNCGKMFQWWNYYWFNSTWTLSKISTTRVSTTWYGWDNPYSNDTYIERTSSPYDRSNPSNNDLWSNSKEEYFVIE